MILPSELWIHSKIYANNYFHLFHYKTKFSTVQKLPILVIIDGMRDICPMKPVLWIGSSLKDLRDMPEDVQSEFGHSLREIQKGKDPGNTKPLKHLGESGISEIRVDDRAGTFRTVYTVEFKDVVAVLHVFQKKSKEGIATPKKEIDLVLQRLKQARIEYHELKREK
jgi:phage-related protein